MKKANFIRILLLVLVLTVLPLAAFADVMMEEQYNPGGTDYRWVITTTYQGQTTTRGSTTSTLAVLENPNSKSQSVSCSYSAKDSWSLTLGFKVKKSWLPGRSADYGQTATIKLNVNTTLGAHKRLTVYKRIDTTTKKWLHYCTYQYKDHNDKYWINQKTVTYYSTETHKIPVLWTKITDM